MVKHIIFDCFGTLIDTRSNSLEATQRILINVKADVDTKKFYSDWKKIKKQMADSPEFLNEKTLFACSLAETFALYHIKADAAVEVKPMIETLFGRRPVFSDVKETLKCLKEKELDIALGSTSDTDSLLFYLDQNQLVLSNVFTSEDVKAYKPNLLFYEMILNRSGGGEKNAYLSEIIILTMYTIPKRLE